MVEVAGNALFDGSSNERGPGGIFTDSMRLSKSQTLGSAGNIDFQAQQLILRGGTAIKASTRTAGNGGNITIQTKELNLSGKNSGGISGIFTESINPTVGAGNAGDISVQANTISLTEGGEISTLAIRAEGGNIQISSRDLLYLQGLISLFC